MNSLNQERERVVDHTMSLVDDVNAVRQASNPPAASEPVAARRFGAAAGTPDGGFIAGTSFEGSMRDEIVRRVTAFRDLQIRIGQERRQYCDTILAETRVALGHGVEPAAKSGARPSR
jgi:hypothetical protein